MGKVNYFNKIFIICLVPCGPCFEFLYTLVTRCSFGSISVYKAWEQWNKNLFKHLLHGALQRYCKLTVGKIKNIWLKGSFWILNMGTRQSINGRKLILTWTAQSKDVYYKCLESELSFLCQMMFYRKYCNMIPIPRVLHHVTLPCLYCVECNSQLWKVDRFIMLLTNRGSMEG